MRVPWPLYTREPSAHGTAVPSTVHDWRYTLLPDVLNVMSHLCHWFGLWVAPGLYASLAFQPYEP